ncbi:hypothetical protein AB4Z42_27010 [Mycobacterium sp. 2YAF39]|uniref:hypothetical protein n=1 Tax=Mycobacterium sp. 2YAF39 TaxID=3233033 RepID=UPI003F9D0908
MELPLPDYDQMPLNEIRHRIRMLEEGPLRRLFEHEAEPSPGDPASTPGAAKTPSGSPVQESTAAEPGTPLRHGVAAQTPSRGRP